MVTLRICTMKSRIGFGTHGNTPIENVLGAQLDSWVRYIYYNFEQIDFTDDVKDAARIRISIPKPGVDKNAWGSNEKIARHEIVSSMTDLDRMKRAARFKRIRNAERRATMTANFYGKQLSKGTLQAVNQGKAFLAKND